MAISEDTANQPVARHVTVKTATTASFSPQAATLLVALVAANGANNAATTVAVTDSLAGSWTLLSRENVNSGVNLGGSSEVWCRYLASAPGAMTVTAAWSAGDTGGNLVVRSLLGAASTQTGATGVRGGDLVAPNATLTPTQLGSWVYGASLAWITAITYTVNAANSIVDQFVDSTDGATWGTFKASAATASLVSGTYGFSNSTSAYNTAAAEILPAAAAAAQPSPLIIGQAVGRASLW